tara:strand:- start:7098 stop:8192 length:1095 start_codon:yes stop_codon:yes gene_type:complete
MTFKPLNENDIVATRTLLHEAIPLTGTIVSGTYDDGNIKDYTHGMFQSVYDYPFLSSSANHIFDITIGINQSSPLYSSVSAQQSKKRNIYNQMAQVLVGYDATGSVRRFDEDGDLIGTTDDKLNDVIILPFSRLLTKDEIKKETFEMTLGVNPAFAEDGSVFNKLVTISDLSASTEYRVNSPAGEYGILYATASVNDILDPSSTHTSSFGGDPYWRAGLIYYQAGVVVLTGSVFGSLLTPNSSSIEFDSGLNFTGSLTGSNIDLIANGLRNRIQNIQFNNTTELNSTVYFCRVNHNEFNYSANPTYLSGSKIRVKTKSTDNPVAYITSIGLYNDNNELMASAKLSEPLKKSSDNEYTLRARIDY